MYLGDAALHDEEVRVVDVQLHAVEHGLHPAGLRNVPVDQVLVAPANHQLHSRMRDSQLQQPPCHVQMSGAQKYN